MSKTLTFILVACMTLVFGRLTIADTNNIIRKYSLNQVNAAEFFQSLGFLVGQNHTVKKIEKKYPDYLLIPKLKFQSTFPGLQQKMESIAEHTLGKSEFDKFYIRLKQQASHKLIDIKIDENLATEFHQQLLSRSMGNIESPFLETFLSVLYLEQPEQEFLKGYTTRFSSFGHPKSKGVEVEFDLPKSWRGKEGKRPNVIQQWTNQNGYGTETINLVIKDLGYVPTNKDILDFYENKATLRQILMQGMDLKAAYLTEIEGQKAIYTEAAGAVKRGAYDLNVYTKNVLIFYESSLLTFTCSIGAQSHEIKSLGGNLISPLCDLILNSVVFPKLYR
jgi:hypothetical protein